MEVMVAGAWEARGTGSQVPTVPSPTEPQLLTGVFRAQASRPDFATKVLGSLQALLSASVSSPVQWE